MPIYLFLWIFQNDVPDIDRIFMENDQKAFANLLHAKDQVSLDLQPLIQDSGMMSKGQAMVSFRTFNERFKVLQTTKKEPQTDTNYGWLELRVVFHLEDKKNQQTYTITAAYQFKLKDSQHVLTKWHLLDLR